MFKFLGYLIYKPKYKTIQQLCNSNDIVCTASNSSDIYNKLAILAQLAVSHNTVYKLTFFYPPCEFSFTVGNDSFQSYIIRL